MATKKTLAVVEQPNNTSPDVRTEEFSAAQRELAEWLRIDVSASADVRTERAIHAYNLATRHMVESGLLLASVRAEVSPEAFAALLEERGMAKQRASELMRGAAFVARMPAADRERVMALHQSKVTLLASASPAAVEAALADDEFDIDLIGVRSLRQRIRDLEANLVDTQVQRDSAEAEAKGLAKRLAKLPGEREDAVPMVVADLRAEIMAQGKKASLAADAFKALGVDVMGLIGTEGGHGWADATLRLAVAQLVHVRLQIDGIVKSYLDQLPGKDPTPSERSYLTQQEVLETAKAYEALTQTHTYEAALREWERQQQRPRGKGRPTAKPVAPGGEA